MSDQEPVQGASAYAFLEGGGEMGARMRAYDWASSPLGPIEGWPQSLKTASAIVLRSPVPLVMLWGEDGVMIYNDAYSVFAGGRHPKLLGSKVRKGWPEVADFNDNVMKVGLAGGTLAYKDQELTLYRKGVAEQVWINLDYSPILGEDGDPAGVLAIVVETTERVLAERRAQQERDHLAQMFQQAPGFICTLRGPQHIFEFVNDAHKRLFNSAGWVGKPLREAFPELKGQGFFELVDQVYATGERLVFNATPVRMRFGQGEDTTVRLLDFVYAPMFDEYGAVSGIFCEGYDVTDRLRAEEALRDSEARYRTLFDSIDEGFCVLALEADEDGQPDFRYLEGNPALEQQSGISDVVGRTVRQVLGDEARAWIETFIPVVKTGKPLRFERELQANGRLLELFAFRVEPESRQQVAILFRDVSAERYAQAELRRLNEELESRIAHAVVDRAQAEAALHQSQKMEAVGQLTGGVAHDFNNLLTPIVGALDMLRRRLTDDERAQRLTNGALQAADRAQILVHRLLAFSRRQHLTPRAVDVRALTESMVDLFSRSLGPRIKIMMDIPSDLPPAHVDPNQLELALLNLAVNARDAIPHDGVLSISARLETTSAGGTLTPGDYVRIVVADTGHGMDEQTLRRAIEPFFTTKGVGRGTGLGLSSVQGMAEQSGGAFSLTSQLGVGTTATLWLPVSKETLAAVSWTGDAAATPRLKHSSTILLVDDEDLVRMGTADMLTEAGYSVEEASSGFEAMQMIRSGLPADAVVTDYAMHGMTGAELAQELRRFRPNLPILMITGYATLADHEARGLPRLPKPFRQADLASAVAEILSERPRAGSAKA